MVKILAVILVLGLAIWGAFAAGIINVNDGENQSAESSAPAEESSVVQRVDDPLLADDGIPALADEPDGPDPRPIMQTQVIIGRLGFSSGVIDGEDSARFRAALRGFQQSHDLQLSGELDTETRRVLAQWDHIPSTRTVTIPAEFARGPFVRDMPEDIEAKAELERLGYTSLVEKLAERFHTTRETLIALNPDGATVRAGGEVVVPNVGNDRIEADAEGDHQWIATLASLGVASRQPEAASVVVDESDGIVMAYDEDENLIGLFPATMGSEQDPLPIGEWEILGASFNPVFHYNPDLFWDAEASDEAATLQPGPNSPVGVVWIDLSKEHYGIHGTPEPQNIGMTESHGCIRLTNWDAARLAQMVRPGIVATFRE